MDRPSSPPTSRLAWPSDMHSMVTGKATTAIQAPKAAARGAFLPRTAENPPPAPAIKAPSSSSPRHRGTKASQLPPDRGNNSTPADAG